MVTKTATLFFAFNGALTSGPRHFCLSRGNLHKNIFDFLCNFTYCIFPKICYNKVTKTKEKERKEVTNTMVIKQTLILNENEFDTINKASKIIDDAFNRLNVDEELVADSTWSYDEVGQVSQFLAEVVACTVTIEKKGY